MSRIENAVVGAVLLVAASAVHAQVVGDFECQLPGSAMTAVADCEGWVSAGGMQAVVPDGTFVTGPCANMPVANTQWAEVNNRGLGPASPVVPPGTPTYPFAPGTVSEMRLLTTALTDTIAVDWCFATGEDPNDPPFIDFVEILIIDPATMGILAPLVFADTTTQPLAAGPCTSGVSGVPPANAFIPMVSAYATIPSGMVGQPILIVAVAGNQSGSGVESFMWIDNLRFVSLPHIHPGTGEDFSMHVRLNGSRHLGDVHPVNVSDLVELRVFSSLGTFDGSVLFVAAELFSTGSPPTGALPGIVLSGNLATTVLVAGGPVPPFGLFLTLPPAPGFVLQFPYAGGLATASVLFQAIANNQNAANSIFASTDGNELQFN